jgi:protein-tyrosine-phosphatase
MADLTWGVKVSEDFKEEIVDLISKSGKQSKEFMELLISLYKAEVLKQEKPQIMQELEELQALTQRIYGIFFNIGERTDNLMKSQAQGYEEELEQYRNKLHELEEAFLLEKKNNSILTESFNNLAEKKLELETGIERLTEIIGNQKALIESLNDKIRSLNTSIEDYSTYKENYNNLVSKFESTKNSLKITEESAAQKDDIIAQMKKSHQEELNQLREKLDIEHSKAILELKLAHQKNIEDIQDKNNSKISTLHEKISQDNEKIQRLLERTANKEKGASNKNGKS